MPYLNETGLSYYNSLLQPWIAAQGVKNAPSALFNFQQTPKAGAVTCWPVGGTPLAPTVDYIFTETPPSNGQPKAPDNPSTITGVNSVKVTRCGKNLVSYPYKYGSQTISDVVFTVGGDGSITVNGTAGEEAAVFRISQGSASNPTLLKKGLTYFLSGCPSGGSANTYMLYLGSYGSAFSAVSDRGSGVSITPEKESFSNLYIHISAGASVSNLVFKPQIELGSSGSEFEKGTSTDYTISLGDTYYGGSIDLATGMMTVTHESMILNGNTTFAISGFAEYTNCYKLQLTPSPNRLKTIDANSAASDTLPVDMASPTDFAGLYLPAASSLLHVVLSKADIGVSDNADRATVVDAYNAWFALHPTTLVYPLAVPYTVQLSPVQISALAQTDKYTPRINTVYSDQQAVQVGYVKSPVRNEFELQQAVVGLGGNI